MSGPTYVPAVDAWREAVWFDPNGGVFWSKPGDEMPEGYRRLYVLTEPPPVALLDHADDRWDYVGIHPIYRFGHVLATRDEIEEDYGPVREVTE